MSYYGSGVPSMLDRLASVNCPTLFHFGSRDPYIAGEGVEAVGSAIAGHPRFHLNVEIAGHAFDNQAPMYHDEAAARSAWAKTMAFLADHLPVRVVTRVDAVARRADSHAALGAAEPVDDGGERLCRRPIAHLASAPLADDEVDPS